MKNIIITGMAICFTCLTACTKLDVKVESEYTSDNFPTTADGFIAASGPMYTQLSSKYAVDYWRLQELSTDEAIIPARDGNYEDGGQYRFLHKHTWTKDHPTVKNVWQWAFSGVTTCNRILTLFQKAPESKSKQTSLAEVRTMRALYYFFLMDLFGKVPIITSFDNTSLPEQSSREAVFTFIEKELKESLPLLNTKTGQVTYSKPVKWFAFALLEKMYLNAVVYTGRPMYTEAVAMADSVLVGGAYTLDDNFINIFTPDNGPQVKETIFAIPYDTYQIKGNQFSRFGLHPGLVDKYSLLFRPSIAMSTIASFYEKFNLTGDIRNNTWLEGKQFNSDGSPIMISTTNKGLDNNYAGPDPGAKISWQLSFSKELKLRVDSSMDLGNDELAKASGVRGIKFYPDKNTEPQDRNSNNDVPVMRLADVMLMKAEAILRGAAPTAVKGELQTADVLVNKIRARAHAPLISGITLDGMLDERAREMAWEAWRRNDLIRFNKFESAWGFKTDGNTFHRVYPVPASELTLNPKLVQNTGY
ncbi:RagB/SusD family nutrient uptake outer membrane protein [Chitinophaga eiseniae]|uniref:RagB/SusD family nutrient uptake outer membrane protein n=1 Tax=Chitinophaga eiseniae TaxID=634771 RepID=A0A847SIR0_9BACT|nr:RagB/SusD family nutrient uptake outer membrane protein [Chitinophaga eiseniae]NLR79633.1 RagB/SusD family nutrient uptake outer membrane protein [Chitinophaga eiseniae]